jgi:hypothetical protein
MVLNIIDNVGGKIQPWGKKAMPYEPTEKETSETKVSEVKSGGRN